MNDDGFYSQAMRNGIHSRNNNLNLDRRYYIEDTKFAANRIYNNRVLHYNRNNNNNDDDNDDEKAKLYRRGYPKQESMARGVLSFLDDVDNDDEVKKIRQQHKLQCKKLEAEKELERKEKEEQLRIAQKIHEFEMQEIKNEKERLEKLVANLQTDREKLPAEKEKNLAVPAAAPAAACSSEESKDEDSITCVICMDAKREILCMPCLHVVLCTNCSKNLQTCPVCMTKAEMKKIFLS